MSEVEVNKYGTNKKIKYHILSDDKMRKIGFTDRKPDIWYFFRGVAEDISFNVSIPKDGVSDLRIDVLDENFLRTYDFQMILSKNPDFKFALEVKEQVEKWMTYLKDNAVLSGWEIGDYI